MVMDEMEGRRKKRRGRPLKKRPDAGLVYIFLIVATTYKFTAILIYINYAAGASSSNAHRSQPEGHADNRADAVLTRLGFQLGQTAGQSNSAQINVPARQSFGAQQNQEGSTSRIQPGRHSISVPPSASNNPITAPNLTRQASVSSTAPRSGSLRSKIRNIFRSSRNR
jgi:hypothetical protein